MTTTERIAEERRWPPATDQVRTDSAAVRRTVTEVEEQARTLIRERPVMAVLAAAGIGYLLARIVARVTR
jgi:ElaB/YqjD/DUF883 family membrane-anchored ribosome-binding protein